MKIKTPDSLFPVLREMKRGRCEGQNLQPLKEVQRLEGEEALAVCHLLLSA
jgi:hypothetical protein